MTIVDDDPKPTVSVTASANAASEAGPTSTTYTITRAANLVGAITVAISFSGTAKYGTDYTASGSGVTMTSSGAGMVTLADGVGSVTVTLAPIDDTVYEGTETATLTLGACPACATVSPTSATVSVLDNDVAPRVSIVSSSTPEGDAGSHAAMLQISLSGASGLPVSVVVTMNTGAPGTATAGSDYQGWSPTSQTVTIAAGATGASISVTVYGDHQKEADETVYFTLSNAQGATLGTSSGVLTIVNDDSKLMATSTGPGGASSHPTSAQVHSALVTAIAFWVGRGADAAKLRHVQIVWRSLPGAILGEAVDGTVVLDKDAAGWGWSARLNGVGAHRIDLLTVLAHELGHVLGLDHAASGVMEPTLSPGLRVLESTAVKAAPVSAVTRSTSPLPHSLPVVAVAVRRSGWTAPSVHLSAPAPMSPSFAFRGSALRPISAPFVPVVLLLTALYMLAAAGRGLRKSPAREWFSSYPA